MKSNFILFLLLSIILGFISWFMYANVKYLKENQEVYTTQLIMMWIFIILSFVFVMLSFVYNPHISFMIYNILATIILSFFVYSCRK